MKQYRASKKQIKTQIEQKQKSINTFSDAIKARKARQELLSRAVAKANDTALQLKEQSNKTRQFLNNAKKLIE
jgi:chromosome segregation ATPase